MTRAAAQIRQEFIDFFCRKHGHAFVRSSPVVPHDDPTLLFTNAGMNQFKPYFLGTETPQHRRVANTQKCIRAGGKHNDLDDVGHDTYHHTFFEMLGNWSFGDYFKAEAIAWAWELLVDVWGIDPTRLHATYFGGDESEGLAADDEARDLWLKILPPQRVHPGNKKDNFWEMGDTGPCGPCSEIHIDLTPDKTGGKLVNAGDARAIEIWNLVFIQFNRGPDGKLTSLPSKHVDTGMGFERVTAILQGHNNNYATDVFVPVIQAIEKISGHTYGGVGASPAPSASQPSGVGDPPAASASTSNRYARFTPGDMRDEACRVIADHIRCLTFALTDGAVPDKEGRGYVLRRILRRAVRYGWQYLDLHKPFLCDLVDTVVATMGDAFPELRKNPQHVKDIIREEEESFERTLDRGIDTWWSFAAESLMQQCITEQVRGRARPSFLLGLAGSWASDDRHLDPTAFHRETGISPARPDTTVSILDPTGHTVVRQFLLGSITPELLRELYHAPPRISGAGAFKLHDTYGFPIDLTQVMAQEKGLTVDIVEYERLMEDARERARASSADLDLLSEITQIPEEHLASATDDSWKYNVEAIEATYRFMTGVLDGTEDLWTGRDLIGLVFDRTCFYAEQGGQVGDTGTIQFPGRPLLQVARTIRAAIHIIHLVNPDPLRGTAGIRSGETATLAVDRSRRATMKNHTATHVMNWALREVLGDHVQQKGSLVDPEKTRFDFSHPKALTPEQIERVEQLVNEKIRANLPVHYKIVPKQQVMDDHGNPKVTGLRAVFGEKYPDQVRVMSIGVPVDDLLAHPDNPHWRQYSIEFCGGTHLHNTADIERFAIVSEEAVAKGVRRIVAVTGDTARQVEAAGAGLIEQAERLKRGPAEQVPAGLAELQPSIAAASLAVRDRMRLAALVGDLQQIVKQQHKAEAADATEVVKAEVYRLLATAEKIGDTTVLVAELPDVPVAQLKTGADLAKQKCGSAAILFGVHVGRNGPADEQTALLLAALTDDLVKRGLKAGDLVKEAAKQVNGGGGGPPTMAQAGGKNPAKLGEALAAGKAWISAKLK